MKLAWIGFSDPKLDFWEKAEALAKMGYRGMENATELQEGKLEENVKRFHDLGLEVLTINGGFHDGKGYFDRDTALKNIQENVKLAKAVKTNRVTFWVNAEVSNRFHQRPTCYDDLMRDIDVMNKAIEIYASEGITVAYHNHYQEFAYCYNNVPIIYHMLLNCDPRLKLVLDVGWAAFSGEDPVKMIERFSSRIASLHLKDMRYRDRPHILKDFPGCFTSLGTGVVPIHDCLKKAKELELPWAVVEQDTLNRLDTLDSLRSAYYQVKESGALD